MLILTRGPGESIVMPGEGIEIIVLGSCGTEVKIGIEAPKEISIVRKELLDRVKKSEE